MDPFSSSDALSIDIASSARRGGGMDRYLAATPPRAQFALKLLKPECWVQSSGVERCLARSGSRQTAAPAPVALFLFLFSKVDGLLFYVMPSLKRVVARGWIARRVAVNERFAARWPRGALDYAHRHNVVPRDLKRRISCSDGQTS